MPRCETCGVAYETWAGFKRHMAYKKNRKCHAIYCKLPWPPPEEAVQEAPAVAQAPTVTNETVAVAEATTTPRKRPSVEISTPDSPSFAPFPASESPESTWEDRAESRQNPEPTCVNTRPKTRGRAKRIFSRASRVTTRSRARDLREKEKANDPTEVPNEELQAENTNHGDYSDEEGDDNLPNLDDPVPPNYDNIDTSMWDQFNGYCEKSYKDRLPFLPEIKAAVELMALLTEKRVPLNVYDEVFQWHLSNLKASKFINRNALVKTLRKRYNMEKTQPTKLTKLRLPYSGSRINLVIHDAKYQIQSLLTDPRLRDQDYLFFQNNPFQGPPEEFDNVSDINTGRAYRETYRQLITDPTKQVLLPVIFYMDAAITGQFDNLPIEALKITLGIFNQKARDEGRCWREIGYMTKYVEAKTAAEELLLTDDHIDAKNYVNEDKKDWQEQVEENDKAYEKGQDMHFMLAQMLEPYRKLQESGGFTWRLRYRGQTHDVHFIPFIMFVKGDAVELDKHCGHYTSRTEKIKQLCRYCTVPNEKTDDPWKRYDRKSPQMIKPLVDAEDLEALKLLSQQCIDNVWYKLRFGLHNDLGIHGASPVEILHWVNIGKFGYTRANLFDQLGEDSNLMKEFNKVCTSIGYTMARQSNRELPRTKFDRGVTAGKLQGHEMTGLLLTIASAFRTTKGRLVFSTWARGDQKLNWNAEGVKLWVELIERQLQYEAWLKSPELSVEEVKLAEVKIRDLMQMEKDVGHRTEGMGFRTWNFHCTSHVAEDILDFGVPNNTNTDSNEMHHKPGKTAAKRTQRQPDTFDEQCAKQIHNMLCVLFAIQEIAGFALWEYSERDADEEEQQSAENTTAEFEDNNEYDEMTGAVLYEAPVEVDNGQKVLAGTKAILWQNELNEPRYKVLSRMKNRKLFKYHKDCLAALHGVLQAECIPYGINELTIYTEHKRKGEIFRASPYYMGRGWMDWVMVDWGEQGGITPAQIWGFIDLRALPDHANQDPGIYALVESTIEVKTPAEVNRSRLFVPYRKHIANREHDEITRQFWLVDTEAFTAPTAVIPDIGNEDDTAVLMLKPKHEWVEDFSQWLQTRPKRANFPPVL